MSNDILSQALREFNALSRRVDNSVEVGFTAFKGLTWDMFTVGKTPTQILRDVQEKAAEFERREQEYRRKNG